MTYNIKSENSNLKALGCHTITQNLSFIKKVHEGANLLDFSIVYYYSNTRNVITEIKLLEIFPIMAFEVL